ncbi:DUF6427 family protein [uncultured Croceitalea sp.]|uniref:DUF6427 family protein n=1 Tax=uncultured Croceitalea sp. TaxID=1798908 RepID=UPI00330570BE
MISSFFSKTKPINYLVLLIFLLVFYTINFFAFKNPSLDVVLFALVLIATLLQVIGVQEIVRKSKTTNTTSFAMLFFVLLCMAIPQIIHFKEVVFCNLFLMLSLNRLLPLKNLKQVKSKIFDATLWICVASIFDPWVLLFLTIVFLAVYVYGTKDFKNWLVPIVAIIFFVLLLVTFLTLTKNIAFLGNHYIVGVEAGFLESFINNFNLKPFIYIVTVLGLILIVFIKQGYQGVGRIVHLRLLLVYFLVAVFVFSIQNTKTNNYMVLLYSFFPAAIFATNFLETLKKKRLKELVLVVCVLFPFILLIIDLVEK